MTYPYWLDLVEPLNDVSPRWRDHPDSFLQSEQELSDSGALREDLVVAFLKDSNDDWLSEIAPYCDSHPLEWVMNVMSAAEQHSDIYIVQRTAEAIWNYLSRHIHEWLVLKEEAYKDSGIH